MKATRQFNLPGQAPRQVPTPRASSTRVLTDDSYFYVRETVDEVMLKLAQGLKGAKS